MEKHIKEIVKGRPAIDGAGVHLQRVLGIKTIKTFDPFLMLDSFDSLNPDDYIKGFPWHPHRGIETVTYLIEGSMDHEDSLGNKDTIKPRESQWMTGGSGILHQEMPQASKRMLGFQLWINLPQKDKMAQPGYNSLRPNQEIKTIEEDNATINIISGRYKDINGFKPNYVKATILDIELKQNSKFVYDAPIDENTFVFIIENPAIIDNEKIDVKSAVLFSDGDQLTVESTEKPLRFALFHGRPLNEEIVWGGPIVMNTQEELDLAFNELQDGTFLK